MIRYAEPLPGIDFECLRSSAQVIDTVYDVIDDLLLAGETSRVNAILRDINVTKIDITLMLSYMSITSTAKSALQERLNFYDRVKARIIQLEGSSRLDTLLSGLK